MHPGAVACVLTASEGVILWWPWKFWGKCFEGDFWVTVAFLSNHGGVAPTCLQEVALDGNSLWVNLTLWAQMAKGLVVIDIWHYTEIYSDSNVLFWFNYSTDSRKRLTKRSCTVNCQWVGKSWPCFVCENLVLLQLHYSEWVLRCFNFTDKTTNPKWTGQIVPSALTCKSVILLLNIQWGLTSELRF